LKLRLPHLKLHLPHTKLRLPRLKLRFPRFKRRIEPFKSQMNRLKWLLPFINLNFVHKRAHTPQLHGDESSCFAHTVLSRTLHRQHPETSWMIICQMER
jgi:hypothetical protein